MTKLSTDNNLYKLFFLESKKAFQQLVEDSRAGVYIADDEGNLVYVNSAFAAILGYLSKDELLGRNLAKELYEHPEDRQAFLKAVEKTGFVCDYEVRNRRKDGSIAVLSVTSNRVKDEANLTLGVEGIVHDITEKKRIEENLKLEKEELKEVFSFEQSISLIHNVDKLTQFAVNQIAGIFNAQKCSLMFYDRTSEELFIQAAKGLSESIIKNTHKKMGESIAGIVAQKREPTLVVNIEYDKHFQQPNRPHYSTRSFMSVPILFGPLLLGVINVADKVSKTGETFSELDLKMLCLMAQAVGIALENAYLFQQLENLATGKPSLKYR